MFYIKGQTVNDLGAYFKQKAGIIESDLEALDSKVQQVIGMWEGSDQAAYHTAQAAWTARMTELKTCLFNIGNKLEEIVVSYHDTDRRGASLFE